MAADRNEIGMNDSFSRKATETHPARKLLVPVLALSLERLMIDNIRVASP